MSNTAAAGGRPLVGGLAESLLSTLPRELLALLLEWSFEPEDVSGPPALALACRALWRLVSRDAQDAGSVESLRMRLLFRSHLAWRSRSHWLRETAVARPFYMSHLDDRKLLDAYLDSDWVDVADRALGGGHLDLLRHLHARLSRTGGRCRCSEAAIESAARRGHDAALRFVHETLGVNCAPRELLHAAENGHLELVRYLCEERRLEPSWQDVDAAANAGHPSVMRYLMISESRASSRNWRAQVISSREIMSKALFEIAPDVIGRILDSGGDTLREVTVAAESGSIDAVRSLFEEATRYHGSDFSAAADGASVAAAAAAVAGGIEETRAAHAVDAASHVPGAVDPNRRPPFSMVSAAFEGAARRGHDALLRWLYDAMPSRERSWLSMCDRIADAAAGGHLRAVQLLVGLLPRGSPLSPTGVSLVLARAIQSGHLDVLDLLYGTMAITTGGRLVEEDRPTEPFAPGRMQHALGAAALAGHLPTVRYARETLAVPPSTEALRGAAEQGHLHVVRYLCDVAKLETTVDMMRNAVRRGHDAVALYILDTMERIRHPLTGNCQDDGAASLGPSEARQGAVFRMPAFSQAGARLPHACHVHAALAAVDHAITEGRVDVVRSLCSRCPTLAASSLRFAVCAGRLDVVRCLCDLLGTKDDNDAVRGDESLALDYANSIASGADLDLLRYLRETMCVPFAPATASEVMAAAIVRCKTDVVRYLRDTVSVEIPQTAIEDAVTLPLVVCPDLSPRASRDRLALVRYLHQVGGVNGTPRALKRAAGLGDLAVVRYLHRQCGARVTAKAVCSAIGHCHFDVAHYLYEAYAKIEGSRRELQRAISVSALDAVYARLVAHWTAETAAAAAAVATAPDPLYGDDADPGGTTHAQRIAHWFGETMATSYTSDGDGTHLADASDVQRGRKRSLNQDT